MGLEDRQKPNNFDTNSDLAFQFRLARDLKMTVGQLRTTMSLLEFNQWVGFYLWEKKQQDEIRAMQIAESKKRR